MTTRSETSSGSGKLMGSQVPSARTAPEYEYTDGGDADTILSLGGISLDPWQRDILDDWMARDGLGKWAAPSCGGSVPRQNGKTLLIQGRIAAGMLLFNEQVIYTAHLQKTATETFLELKDFFEGRKIKKYLKEIKNALGREQIILKSGARVQFLARTRNGGRGHHGDLLLFDEAQELDDAQQTSFIPALSASANPQTIYTGTPPTPDAPGAVFRGLREKALSGKSGKTAWFEYSVPEIGDVRDRSRWAAANPALGRRIMESTVESECDQMDEDGFARERLGWWSPVAEHVEDKAIDEAAWEACRSEEMKPEGKTAFGVKFSADGGMVALCGAVIPADGPARISLIKYQSTGSGIKWLADWLNQRYKSASCVVIDGRNGVDLLIEQIGDTWKFKGSKVRSTAKDAVAATSFLVDAVAQQEVTWYAGQGILDDSAKNATKRPVGGGWAFGGENSAPIEAAALAYWGAKTSKRNPGRQMRMG